MVTRAPLTPLAHAQRTTVGGFDSRLGLAKTPRLVRAERRAPAGPAPRGRADPLVAVPCHPRGGWGEKGRHRDDFLRADPWSPLQKFKPTSPATAALAVWAPAVGGAPSLRPQTAAQLWRRACMASSLDDAMLSRHSVARLGLWSAGLGRPLAPRVARSAPPGARGMTPWL